MKIYSADAVSVMRSMSPGSVDLCVTDPPYEVITGGNRDGDNQPYGKPSGILGADHGSSFTGDRLHNGICRPRDYMGDLFRVMRDPSHIYIMTNLLNLEETLRQMRLAGFEVHNLLVWKKNTPTPNRWYMKNCEFIIMGRKGAAFPIRDCGSKMVLEYDSVRNRSHPVEKPELLWLKLIENSSKPGDVVFDPFCGSGSSGLAALRSLREYIGVEIDPGYSTIAARRLGVFPSVL